jgi:hypothetical protein
MCSVHHRTGLGVIVVCTHPRVPRRGVPANTTCPWQHKVELLRVVAYGIRAVMMIM